MSIEMSIGNFRIERIIKLCGMIRCLKRDDSASHEHYNFLMIDIFSFWSWIDKIRIFIDFDSLIIISMKTSIFNLNVFIRIQ